MAKNDEKIEVRIGELVKKNDGKHTSENGKKLRKANDEFNELVSKGIIEKKGLTLRGIEDIHLLHLRPNS